MAAPSGCRWSSASTRCDSPSRGGQGSGVRGQGSMLLTMKADPRPRGALVGRFQGRGSAPPAALSPASRAARQPKPLVFLPGFSGRGKPRLTRLYADAVYGDTLASGQDNEHYLLVAVQPDWHN